MTSVASKPLSRKAALESLRRLKRTGINPDDTIREIWNFTAGAKADHRIIALGVVSLLEEALQITLLRSFVPLEKDDIERLFTVEGAIFGTFAARTAAAYAMGLIGPDTRHDFTNIRHIRNACAHVNLPLTFDSPEVAALCNDLKFPWKYVPEGEYAELLFGGNKTPRQKFIASARLRWLALIMSKTENRDPILD